MKMQSSPSTIYSQSIDKQRIVVIGQSSTRIVAMIMFVLNQYKRRFDFSTPNGENLSGAAVLIVEPDRHSNNYSEYKHHILIISQLSVNDKAGVSQLAGLTPKSGTIIYDETDALAREIGKVERTDVTSNPFGEGSHETQNGKAVLISSTKEKFPTQLPPTDLKNISAAKELLKKIGISSSQFYHAIASFQ